MQRFRVLIVFCFAFPVAWVTIASEGSNQGSQATNYTPPSLVGNISFGEVPSAAARIITLAGQRTLSEPNGDYQLLVDAPGIYLVSVRSLLNLQTAMVEVISGQATVLNMDLGTPCEITTWPTNNNVANMVACINGNQPAAKPQRSMP